MDIDRLQGFDLSEYRRLLAVMVARYPCVGFEVLDSHSAFSKFAIVRHDIDMSPAQALALARIEANLGVRSTYTVLLSGEFYSPFERSTRELLREIGNFGHDIGLHFDAAWHGIENESDLCEAIKWEAGVLNRLLELPASRQVKMFSFHNTTPFTMSCKASHYAGLRNACAAYLQENVQYTSDSNGYWIHRSWQQLLDEQPDRVQVLTHPEWWSAADAHPAEKVCSHLASRGRSTWISYRTLLQKANRQNRTGLSVALSEFGELFPNDGDRLMMLWLEGYRSEAFLEAFCFFERQCRRLLRRYFRFEQRITGATVQAILSDYRLKLDPLFALSAFYEKSVGELLGFPLRTYRKIKRHRDRLVHGYDGVSRAELMISFELLIQAVGRLSERGSLLDNPSGIRMLPTKGTALCRDAESLLRWLEANHKRLDLSLQTIRQLGQRQRQLAIKVGGC
ncbi:MAG: hypothetical protein FJY58_05565 [Betaproteobacteria bacterium]|nr:hypothetical protein [Betaproteobacteria bacterium]